MTIELFDYQKTGVDFLATHKMASLWDDPGLGKSIQALIAAKKASASDILICCPASVRLVWADECGKLDLDHRVVLKKGDIGRGINITSYDGASGAMFEEFMKRDWDLLKLDEEHFLKGYNTRTVPNPRDPFRKIKVPPIRVEKIFGRDCDRKNCLGERAAMIWGLTGTPMPNNPAELYPMIRAKFPDALILPNGRIMTYWQFVGRYCRTRDNGFGIKIEGGKNLPELRDQLRGRVMRRKKADVLKDLPEIRYETLPVEGNLKDLPEAEIKAVSKCLEADDPMEALKKNATHVASLRRLTGLAKVKSVAKWVEEAGYDKIVLFAHHRAVIDELKKIKGSVVVDGSCTPDQRTKAVRAFQDGDAKCFIGQIQAAGTGLTLTRASVLVFVEYSWVPAENRQAADRIHRIGQNDNCLVYFATIPGSIDVDIMKVVKRKLETYKELGL